MQVLPWRHSQHELTHKHDSHEIIGYKKCNKVFGKLKHEISNSPPDFQRPFILYADVSSYELGDGISQEDENEHGKTMDFMSK